MKKAPPTSTECVMELCPRHPPPRAHTAHRPVLPAEQCVCSSLAHRRLELTALAPGRGRRMHGWKARVSVRASELPSLATR